MGASQKKNVLMIVGSLRERSLNRQLAEEAAESLRNIAGDAVSVTFLDYAGLPPMNQDREQPVLPEVSRIREHLSAADGIWIVTPEYNHGVPGVLKNLLDWASRPMRADGSSAVAGKPVTYSGAAGGSHASYVLAALRPVLEFMKMEVVDVEPTGVGLDRRAYTTDELSLSEADRESIDLQAYLLLARMEELRLAA